MEYIQDIDGAWLEPHHDIPEKLFSMVIYLCLGPDAKSWGTDIYDSNKKLVGERVGRVRQRGDLHPGREHLARFRTAQDRRRAPADGDQLRSAELALARAALVPRPPDQALLTARRAIGAAAIGDLVTKPRFIWRRALERRAVNASAGFDLTGYWRLVGNLAAEPPRVIAALGRDHAEERPHLRDRRADARLRRPVVDGRAGGPRRARRPLPAALAAGAGRPRNRRRRRSRPGLSRGVDRRRRAAANTAPGR